MRGLDRVEGGRRGWSMLPLVLLVLALIDLRVELILLWDHFTLTSLTAAVRSHLLAVAVLVSQPSLWHHYRRSRG
ncbi:hypothetical protein VB739_00200 [Cyanobium gracile UHCC 0281]|uniref:Rod shape-determining protein MreD n=2 Tax=Cyanobium gracile TaxID=59930 RepID=A0ABU5SR73_9CYAN|nr:hypothetical protein [Cyanobium gracile]MEA5440968.1 hypothetical protein [Cyanobium gracile UHCC 0281]